MVDLVGPKNSSTGGVRLGRGWSYINTIFFFIIFEL
jgi:hypothetical protein